ncbi:hypothetical protein LZ24_02212 [Desulfobotulus alkaliphilus]|uniref:Nucleic acid-binding protein n=1 Tax=Desulfobotulus alkaliphilus TaxID=622671 RepID=A0A562RNW7_9BACT|nr:hypothetical protein LZ24_02212 [Desulfobotulus alkaliphilus]
MSSVLIDTNLLLLLIVGLCDKNIICDHKRTKNFTAADYDLLVSQIDGFSSIWVTSHCLAEVSNLLKQTHKQQAKQLLSCLSTFADRTHESHISKVNIFQNEAYLSLGVSDTGIIQKSKRVSCVYTVDLDLYLRISRIGRKVINFNHLRNQTLLA